MFLKSLFLPRREISAEETRHGMRMLLLDAVFGQTMMVLTTGAFLIGFALSMGASNTTIGILSGLGPLALALQVPSVYLVQRLRLRKLIVTVIAGLSRLIWPVMALLPFFVPKEWLLPLFLALLFVHYALGNVAGCAFNSWIRDIIPERYINVFFARRLSLATAAGAGLSLAGAFVIDLWNEHQERLPGGELGGYVSLFLAATVAGMVNIYYLLRVPEPEMPADNQPHFLAALKQPLADNNFRQVLIFLGAWSFAVNLAAPFFAVYLLHRLGLSMAWVIGLGVASQLFNVAFFGFWGRMADRFSNKTVLVFTAPIFILTFLLWPFTTLPEPHLLTIPLLLFIHAVAGISTAGVNLCAGNLALKSAPYGKAGAYLAINALVSGLAATISPVLAGFLADWFQTKEVSVTLRLAVTGDMPSEMLVPAMDFQGLDFLFFLAFLFGLYAMHRLLSIRESGEIRDARLRQELFSEMVRVARQVSTVAGVRQILAAPFSMARDFSLPEEPATPHAEAPTSPP